MSGTSALSEAPHTPKSREWNSTNDACMPPGIMKILGEGRLRGPHSSDNNLEGKQTAQWSGLSRGLSGSFPTHTIFCW